ncbi:MAG: hypothetical protein CXX69_06160 [Candidatus Thalassarchaeum betae]|uniref:Uncharacterized protein n=1 Tax=Candidatus Thalassarchaeum betae TaxID=2599289 RepID=A0A2V3HT39_9ARCH|nr:MAG: hypothetical protein CXX69_06160 [Candidatus Thalassoarchaea betae]HIM14047.1 hypothetical protein [Candidatus Poseidoniales archaeon]HIM93126.1 hypothetical protein [Candidatus Poseidoniales archaeon]
MDGKTELTIAALIFLAGTAGLVSGEDIEGVETTTDFDDESEDGPRPMIDSHNLFSSPVLFIDLHNLFSSPVLFIDSHNLFNKPMSDSDGHCPMGEYGDDVGILEY